LIDKRQKLYQEIGEFIGDFVRDLNHLTEDGWTVLVEGQRDERALEKLGYKGRLVTAASFARKGGAAFGACRKVVVLTDLDREGSVLASKYVKRLQHDGFRASLRERLRLKVAARGVFLHVENLRRFAHEED
jgi:5S rRNA maturation endonuclease (ribonuclease M5)